MGHISHFEAVDRAATAVLGEAGEQQLLVGEALCAQEAGEVVPADRAVADAEMLGGRLVEAAFGEELAAGLGLGAGQLLHVELRGDLVGLDQPGALAALTRRVVSALLVPERDARLRGEPLDRLGEGEMVELHHEGDGVPALLAAEAVEETLARTDLEGGGLLVVEGAETLQIAAARAAQLEVFGHDGVDRDRVPYRLHVVIVDPASHA